MADAEDAPAALRAYVRQIADLMDLRDWDITVTVGDVDDDTIATCVAVYGQRRATVSFNKSWKQMSADDLRSTTVHELIHCHFGPLDHLVSHVAAAGMDKRVVKVFEAAYGHQMEYVTDALAMVVSRGLPFPEFG